MNIDAVKVANPTYDAALGEYTAMVRFDYSKGVDGSTGQINLICRTNAEEIEAPKVVIERLVAHAIYQLKWIPEFQKGDDSLTVAPAVGGITPALEKLKQVPCVALV